MLLFSESPVGEVALGGDGAEWTLCVWTADRAAPRVRIEPVVPPGVRCELVGSDGTIRNLPDTVELDGEVVVRITIDGQVEGVDHPGIRTGHIDFRTGTESFRRHVNVRVTGPSRPMNPEVPNFYPLEVRRPWIGTPQQRGAAPNIPRYKMPTTRFLPERATLAAAYQHLVGTAIRKRQYESFSCKGQTDEVGAAIEQLLPVIEACRDPGLAMWWVEAMHTATLESNYDIFRTTAVSRHPSGLHWFKVPGVSEKRPNLRIGDEVHVRASNIPSGTTDGVAIVHRINRGQVVLAMPWPSFGARVDLHFVGRDNAAAIAERAGEPYKWHEGHADPVLEPVSWVPYANPNEEQLAAVGRILAMPTGAPHVVFGPPGTGKTTVLVEAAMHLASTGKRVCILAPSTGSADVVASRLAAALDPDELLVACMPTRHETLPDELHKYKYGAGQSFRIPPPSAVRKRRVLVITMDAAILMGMRKSKLNFHYVMVDEAAQAPSRITLAAIQSVTKEQPARIVLYGDHRQLGPVVNFGPAKAHIRSYQDLLMEQTPYKEMRFAFCTMLTKSYRSHPGILHVPSTLFYDGKLEAVSERDRFVGWHKLKDPNVPVMLVESTGPDRYDPQARSFTNDTEAADVTRLVQMIHKSERIGNGTISVVCPFQGQVLKIRNMLRDVGLGHVYVSDVDAVQGREFDAVVVCTVLSGDRRGTDANALGLITCPRQFNVAVTRAKSLLAVVGNTTVMQTDKHWRTFLKQHSDKLATAPNTNLAWTNTPW